MAAAAMAAAWAALAPAPSQAEPAPRTGAASPSVHAPLRTDARRLTTRQEQAAWEAVGRINAGGAGFCTGTLISDRHVITAAHCVVNARTGRVWRPSSIHFVAGYRQGRFAAHRVAAKVVMVDPSRPLSPKSRVDMGDVARDLAILELARPVRPEEARPIPLADPGAAAPRRVHIYSYGRDRAEALSVERDCPLSKRQGEVLFTRCEAIPGVSGAPLIAPGADGGREGARVLGVVSVMGRSAALVEAARRAGRPDRIPRRIAHGPAMGVAADRLGARLLNSLR